VDAPQSLDILSALCEKRGLLFRSVDPFSGYVAKITCPKTGRFFFAGAGTIPAYPGNDAVLTGIANDKAFTYALLAELGIGVPRGDYFFTRSDFADQRPGGKELDAAGRMLAAHFAASAEPLVVKPNTLSRARFVTLARNTEEALDDLRAIAAVDLIGHVQHLIDDPEFRLFIVKGEIVFCYRKGRPFVTGDGRSAIHALTRPLRGLSNPRYLALQLHRRGLTQDSVLPEGETLPVNFIANLGASGDFLGFVSVPESLRAWVRQLHARLPLSVMGIDVFSASGLADRADFIVTDINASPALTTLYDLGHHDVVEEAWEKILTIPFGPFGA